MFILFVLLTITFLFLGFKLTGAFLSAAIWLFIKMPIALTLMFIGFSFCMTILLIPLGIILFKLGVELIRPLSFA